MPRDSRKTRKKILEASVDLLNRGYSPEIGMADFAAHAEVSRQTLYVQFSSRGKLLAQTFRYLNEQLNLATTIEQMIDQQDNEELIAAMVAEWDAYYQRIYWVTKALRATLELEPETQSAWHEWMDSYRQICSSCVLALKNADMLDGKWSRGTSTDLMMSVLSLDSWSFLRNDCGWSEKQYREHISSMLKGTLT